MPVLTVRPFSWWRDSGPNLQVPAVGVKPMAPLEAFSSPRCPPGARPACWPPESSGSGQGRSGPAHACHRRAGENHRGDTRGLRRHRVPGDSGGLTTQQFRSGNQATTVGSRQGGDV